MKQAYECFPSQIETATGGAVRQDDLNNWVRQKLFNTRLPKATIGRPRRFPQTAAWEAALLAQFRTCGVDLRKAKIWNRKILERIDEHDRASVFGSGSGVNIITFNPSHDEFAFASPSGLLVKAAFESINGYPGSDKTYPISETLLVVINVAGICDRMDRALDAERFAPSVA
jgi:hypothetical protein